MRDPADMEQTRAREWLAGGDAAYLLSPSFPARWRDWLAHQLIPTAEAGSPSTSAGPWLVTAETDCLRFQSVSGPIPLARIVLFPLREHEVRLSTLLRLHRAGVHRAWFLESLDGWREWDLAALLVCRVLRRMSGSRWFPPLRWFGLGRPSVALTLAGRLMRMMGRTGPATVWHPAREPDTDLPPLEPIDPAVRYTSHEPVAEKSLAIVHYISALFPGGAERQLCNLAIAQARRGQRVRVLTAYPCTGERGHYAPLLRAGGVPLAVPDDRGTTSLPSGLARMLRADVANQAATLAAALTTDTPDIFHCWLDEQNVSGVIAGLLAGVPRIVLSTRNSNPTNFPRLHTATMRPVYRLAARSPRVHFIANSHSGAVSYAEWLGVPVERFHVVFNGVDLSHFPPATVEERRQARASFGLKAKSPVVCGVFRLAAEKQPGLFLEVVRQARSRLPALQVLLSGDGDQVEAVAEEIRSTGLADHVHLLGRRRDIERVYLASDVMLLTSTLEGCPNVVLESQHLGVPVVATAGGGTVDAVLHGTTGFLAGVRDAHGLANHLLRVLEDEALRSRLARAGPAFVTARFGLEQMVNQTQAVYGIGTGHPRIVPPPLGLASEPFAA